MWGYVNKLPSLEEKALAPVAINLCLENGFKEVALRLEKPTYGCFFSSLHEPAFFVSDPEKLSIWAKLKEDDRLCKLFMRSCYLDDTEKVRQWNTAVDEQCQRLMEGIPNRFRQRMQPTMNRVALEYLSYSRRQEVLFGVSRYFLMDIFTRGDWKETGRLDEMKLAQRLLEDERLPVLQRYRIACVHCLLIHIPQLWERLTQEEKLFTRVGGEETHCLVLLWSSYMNAKPDEKVAQRENYLLAAISLSMTFGNLVAVMLCWKEFREDTQQQMVIDKALVSLRRWQNAKEEFHVKEKLVSNWSPLDQSARFIEEYIGLNIPSYYSELIVFFLSQTDEEQRLTFFGKAFQSNCCSQIKKSVLECFLDWPHQDYFLPTINKLWGIIPRDKYKQCLLALASKYSGNDKTANRDYDYRSLLQALWEATPQDYKHYRQYVYNWFISSVDKSVGKDLLCQLLKRSPFQEKDEALFKQIFLDHTSEKRKEMMLHFWGDNFKMGRDLCTLLMQKGKWSFLNELLEECFPEEEIADLKKRLIEWDCDVQLHSDALKENHERLVEDLLDWFFESDAEKTQYKDKLIKSHDCLAVCESLLREGKFAEVEGVINFCLSSDERKERCKVHFAQRACGVLLKCYVNDSWSEDCVWEQMDRIIDWSVDTEKIRDFKKDLLSHEGIFIHYDLVFGKGVWGKVERFYHWFGFSPQEIKRLKRGTFFSLQVREDIYEGLPEYGNALVDSLRWCLTDEEMVIDLKREVEEEYFTKVLDEGERKKKEQLDRLVSELLDGFRKTEVLDTTSREGVFVKDKGEKRSSVDSVGIEDESTSPRKRHKLI